MADTFDVSELFGEFRDEAGGQIDTLDQALATLHRGEPLADADRVVLMRGLHTLKGNAGMLGLRPIHEFVHAMESVFREPPGRWPPRAVEELMAHAVALRRAVDRVGSPDQEAAFDALAPSAIQRPPDEAEVAPVPPPPLASDAAEAPRERAAQTRAEDLREDTIRIPFARLDRLLNSVGDLAMQVAGLEAWAAAHRDALADAGLRRPLSYRLEETATAVEAIRRAATELRLVPVGRLFARYAGLVGELARAEGKQIRVLVEGGATEVDKATADALAEPLLHLVRNAVDHGIEPPGERQARGKPAEATLTLRAAQEGDRVRIEVEDDGRGLDREAIRRRGQEQNLAPEDADDVAELIFRPGFTTRREVGEVSGRGIGLDAVRGVVARLRGTVAVEDRLPDEPDAGTRFVLRLPLTVALVPALFFSSAGETFAIPASDVESTRRFGGARRAGHAEVVEWEDEWIPLARPARLFGWVEAAEPRYLVVIRRGARAVALTADRLLDQRPATVRALPAALGSPTGVSGASVDAEGRVVLLLDAAGILELNTGLSRTPDPHLRGLVA